MPRANDGSVRGHAAADGEDTLGIVHALDVLGRGLQAHQDNLVTLLRPLVASSAEKTIWPQAAPGEAARP